MDNTSLTLSLATVQELAEQAIQAKIVAEVEKLIQDPAWGSRLEQLVGQAVVQRTTVHIGSIDINKVINQRVDENMQNLAQQLSVNFASTGIEDKATSCQLTVMDDTTVVENQLIAKDLNIIGSTVVNDLIVQGSINTDNSSWDSLAAVVSEKTLEKLTDSWTKNLIDQVADQIKLSGIDFTDVSIDGNKLLTNGELSPAVIKSSLQQLGNLTELIVTGPASINETVTVVKNRLGINTVEPEMALSIWDEEISLIIGKNKTNQAYIGTNRDQGIAIGVNRIPQLEIDNTGLTKIKKLQIGVHCVSFSVEVPGWSGTRGDIVFNANPGVDQVFAWVCLGAYKWQTLKSA